MNVLLCTVPRKIDYRDMKNMNLLRVSFGVEAPLDKAADKRLTGYQNPKPQIYHHHIMN